MGKFLPGITDFPSNSPKPKKKPTPKKTVPKTGTSGPGNNGTPQPPLPPKKGEYYQWVPGTGRDPATFTVDPGQIKNRSLYTSGNMRHARPFLASGSKIFVFPIGVEGFVRSGQAGLSIHKYINDNVADVHVFHREEGRIELTGTFPGITAQDVMTQCLQLLTSAPAEPGFILNAPGVFDNVQYVIPESWNFTHQAGDNTHSIDYQISLLRTGTGKKVKDPHGEAAPPNPAVTVHKPPKGASQNKYVVASGVQTFRQIAAIFYKDADKWQRLIPLNQRLYGEFQRSLALNKQYHLKLYSLPTFRWEIGTVIYY